LSIIFAPFRNTLSALSRDLKVFIDEYQIMGKRVAIWGAGGKGISVMSVAQITGVPYVIDSDPHKIGSFTPVTHIPICAPEQLLKDLSMRLSDSTCVPR
jgi:hypothetical protein